MNLTARGITVKLSRLCLAMHREALQGQASLAVNDFSAQYDSRRCMPLLLAALPPAMIAHHRIPRARDLRA